MQSHIPNSKNEVLSFCTFGLCFIHVRQLIWRSFSHHRKRYTTSSAALPVTLAHFASIGVATLPSATHHCLYVCFIAFHSFMRFTRDHLWLVSSTLRSTRLPLASWATGVTEDCGAFVCIDRRSLVYQLVLLLSVDHQSLLTHLRFQLMQRSQRLSQGRPILLILKLTAATSTHEQICRHMASVLMQHHKIRTDNGLQIKQKHLELTLHARLRWHCNSRLVAVVLGNACCSCGIGVTVFGHRGNGALGPFPTHQHLTIHHASCHHSD